MKNSNKNFFQYSHMHADELIDFSNATGINIYNNRALIEANNYLIDYIDLYAQTSNLNIKKDIVLKIINTVENTENIGYSPFCIYFQVLGYSYNAYYTNRKNLSEEYKINLFTKILNLYIENRHKYYKIYGYSSIVLQICSDLSSSRRKGNTAIEQFNTFLQDNDFIKADNLEDFKSFNRAYLFPDAGQNKLFREILKEYDIKFDFAKTRDNKIPDLLYKINGNIYIVEHKSTSGRGGSQNAEINEIIQFISYGETNANYISCLQGDYFNFLSEETVEPKAKTQYNNIIKYLKKNENNYFVNWNGFKLLIKGQLENE